MGTSKLSGPFVTVLDELSDHPTMNKVFASGAVRSSDADNERFDLVSHVGIRRLAETCAEGAKKYTPHNWRKGMPMSEMLNHAIRHLYLYLGGDRSEDHLAHAAWNLFATMEFEETRPDLDDLWHGSPVRNEAEAVDDDEAI